MRGDPRHACAPRPRRRRRPGCPGARMPSLHQFRRSPYASKPGRAGRSRVRCAGVLRSRREPPGRREILAGRARHPDPFRARALARRAGVRDHGTGLRPGRAVRRRRHLPRLGRPHRLRRRVVRDARGLDRTAVRELPARRAGAVRPLRADHARRRARARTRSSTASAAGWRRDGLPVAARHPGLAARADGDPARRDRARGGDLRRRRLPRDGGAADRGHVAVRPHERRGLGRRDEGDVLVRRPRRPRPVAPPRADGRPRARVPAARPRHAAAAGAHLQLRQRVPVQPHAARPAARVRAVRRRGDRLGRPGGRRGDHRAPDALAGGDRDGRARARDQLDRHARRAPRLRGRAAGLPRRARRRACRTTSGGCAT